MARRHQVYGLATWWHEVAPAPVKCQAADRVAALGTVSGSQEHARHADTAAFSTSLRAPLLVCKGSVGHKWGIAVTVGRLSDDVTRSPRVVT